MRKALNYSVAAGPGGMVECDSFTCAHCQRIVPTPPGVSPFDAGGGCHLCAQLICPQCVDKGTCKPWGDQMLEIERKFESDRMTSRLLGRE